uniref:Uncharacterized protein n=1 Tax=Parascaris equorum TaxID=6256 RepID=A0A914RIW6_PAREQ
MAKELFQKASIIEGFSSTGSKSCTIKDHARALCELIDFCIHEIHSSTKVAHVITPKAILALKNASYRPVKRAI